MSVPDPTILARGLGKMMKKLVSMHAELHFRLQLIRSTLMVDAVPTHDSASKYSEHLLAELEQMGHQSRKRDTVPEVPKLKKFEEPSRDSKEVKERREEKEKSKCRFYLTDQGCRRGKSCAFSQDQKDERKRCWICGCPDHFAPNCTKMAKVEKEKNGMAKGESDGGEDSQPSIKDLLKEANEMLKGMGGSSTPSSSGTSPTTNGGGSPERSEVVERLQQQLNALRQKTFRLCRLKKGEKKGLLDSGATHALRPSKKGEDKSLYQRVHGSIG